jgi:hypothetical protein
VVFGIGIIAGSIIAGYVGDWAVTDGRRDYTKLFSVPMWGAVACLALMLACYPRGRGKAAASDAEPVTWPP